MFMKVPPIWMTSAPAIIKDSDFHTLIQVLKYICLTDVFPIVTLISMKLKRFFLVNFLKISLTFHMCVRGLLKIQAVRRSLVVVLCEMFQKLSKNAQICNEKYSGTFNSFFFSNIRFYFMISNNISLENVSLNT